MRAVYRKELRSYFHSIIGYLFIGVSLALIGFYHYVFNYSYPGTVDYSATISSVSGIMIFLLPFLSMRIMAEENRQRTDQLLFTSPVSVTGIIVGKYLAMITLPAIVLAVCCFQPLILSEYGEVNIAGSFIAILGAFLLFSAYLAIGLYISSSTENQIIAAIITFVVIIVCSLIDVVAVIFPTDAGFAWTIYAALTVIVSLITYFVMKNILVSSIVFAISEVCLSLIYLLKPTVFEGSLTGFFAWFSVNARISSFCSEIFSLADTIYYLSVIALFVFLTIENVEKRRWN